MPARERAFRRFFAGRKPAAIRAYARVVVTVNVRPRDSGACKSGIVICARVLARLYAETMDVHDAWPAMLLRKGEE